MGKKGCPETSGIDYQPTLRNIPEDSLFYIATEAWNHATFGFQKMRVISWLAEDYLVSKEGLCST